MMKIINLFFMRKFLDVLHNIKNNSTLLKLLATKFVHYGNLGPLAFARYMSMSNISYTLEYYVDALRFQWKIFKTSYVTYTCVIHTCLCIVHVIQLAWAECQEKFGSSLLTWLTLLMQFHHQLLAHSFTAQCCNLVD